MGQEAEVVQLDIHSCCRRCTSLAESLRAIADMIGLRDWEVVAGHEPPADVTAQATAEMVPGRKIVRVRVCEGFELLDVVEQTHALTHELYHALTRDAFGAAVEGVREELGGTAFRIHAAACRRQFEGLVDVLAYTMAPHVPRAELDQ